MKKLIFISALSQLFFVEYTFSYSEKLTATEEFLLLPGSESPCLRPCQTDSTPMVCRYKFTVEWYQTMSRACYNCPQNTTDCMRPHCIAADGFSRPVLTINRQMPGPSIQVCQGDEIIVDVENHLQSEETTIHWHGHHQRGTPYMDGVPYVTQCPIPSGNTFRYHFRAAHAGTHFWHSHSGLQRGEGAFGSMIVRQPKDQDIQSSLYDFDLPSHVIIVLDWVHDTGLSKFTYHMHSSGDNKPDSLLVNGLGYFQLTNKTEFVPAARFTVQKGFRYRFRVINAEFLNCPITVSVDNHSLTVISSDGNNFEPVEVESFVTYAGERFDFVLNADQEVNNYWIRFRGLMDCDQRFTSAHQVAVLHYSGAEEHAYPPGEPDYQSSQKEGPQLNTLNEGTSTLLDDSINIVEMNATVPNDISLKETPDFQFYISYDFYNISNPHFYSKGLYEYYAGHPKFRITTPQLNHISMKFQPFALLPGRSLIKPGMFCNETSVQNCEKDFCQCTHVLQIPLNSVVELVLVDKGEMFDANHPFHLHGNSFRVVAMERLGSTVTVEEVQELDRVGLIDRKLDRAPVKDTVTVPDGGFTILRFHANNPGFWLFHCHIDFHAEIGMAIVFKIGENEDLPPVPKGFPQCGNWMPEDVTTEKFDDVITITENFHDVVTTTEKFSDGITTTQKISDVEETTTEEYDFDNSTSLTRRSLNRCDGNMTFFQQIWNDLHIADNCDKSSASKVAYHLILAIFSISTLSIS